MLSRILCAAMDRHAPAEARPGFVWMLQWPGRPRSTSRGLVRTFQGSPKPQHELSWASGTEKALPLLIGCEASRNSRIASETHQQEGPVMSTASRILALSLSLIAILAMSTGSVEAADRAVQPVSIAGADPGAPRWSARPLRSVELRHARCELVEGVRGATPLTVPFFGSGWYPGPAHYGPCWRHRGGRGHFSQVLDG